MSARRILVTGAAGFVGRHLMAALRRDVPEAELHPSSFDLTDADAVREGVRRIGPDACIHLAAVSAVSAAHADPNTAWQVNLIGTLTLGRAILEFAPRCRVVFASSADAYGATFASGLPLAESAPLAPLNTYAATKAAADLALGAMAAEGLDVVRLRLFNHTGAGQSDAFVVAAFARQIARIEAGLQEPTLHVGALDPRRDFLDVRDVCAAYVACTGGVDGLEPGTILNIASGVPRRVGDILDQLRTLARDRSAVSQDASRLRPTDIASATGDADRARQRLGWHSVIPWERTLADVLADWRVRVRSGPAA